MRQWLNSVRAAKLLLAITVMMASAAVFADAKAAEAAQAAGSQIHLDLQQWSPATVLAVVSVVFSFGISYQTIRVHGKVLQDFEDWRAEHVDPKLGHHATEIEVLKSRLGPWDGTERRKHARN